MGISILRIWAIAANSFREVIRDRILYFIGFFALLMAFAWRLLPEIAVGTHEKIFLDLGLAAIGLLGVIVAVFVGTGLINKEIDKRTILVLIPKPLSRAEFILGKHLGLSGVLAVMLGNVGDLLADVAGDESIFSTFTPDCLGFLSRFGINSHRGRGDRFWGIYQFDYSHVNDFWGLSNGSHQQRSDPIGYNQQKSQYPRYHQKYLSNSPRFREIEF